MEREKVNRATEQTNFLNQATDFSNQTIQDMHQEGERAIQFAKSLLLQKHSPTKFK
jgi:hypothetical protein